MDDHDIDIKPALAGTNPAVIDVLEKMLADARAGKLLAFCAASVYTDKSHGRHYAGGHAVELIGAMRILEHIMVVEHG